MTLTENDLLDMSDDELDELFRQQPCGRDPGRRRRRARCSSARSDEIIRTSSAWIAQTRRLEGQGLRPREGRPQATRSCPFGLKAVRAKVYKEASWFDGKETIVLDYSKTSVRRARRFATRSARSRRASTSGSSSGSATRSSTSRSSSTGEQRRLAAMPYQQCADDRRARSARAREDELESLLATMGDGVANGSVLDFGALDGVHFARLLLVAADADRRPPLPASLILLSDFDVSRATAPRASSSRAQAQGIDRVFGHCEGYPAGEPSARRSARLPPPPRRQGGRDVREHDRSHGPPDPAGGGAARRDRGFLDDRSDWGGRDPDEVRRAVREFVEQDPALAWALEPAERPELARAPAGEGAPRRDPARCCLPLPAAALLAAPFYAFVLRRHERRDQAPHVKPSEERVLELAALEDHLVQNPFTAIGHVKPSRVPAADARRRSSSTSTTRRGTSSTAATSPA